MADSVCLHGFVPAGAPAPPADLHGIEGTSVAELAFDGFRAVYTPVDPAAYDEESVRTGMQDLGWVAARGLEHERVVSWYVDHAQILPVPLLTLYSSVEVLRRAAIAHSSAIRAQIDRFGGMHEWDLKISCDADRVAATLGAISEGVAALDAQIARASPGRRYLLEKKRAGIAREEAASAARRLAEELLESVHPLAAEVRQIPLPKTRDLPVVLYAALLIDAANATQTAARVREASARYDKLGLRVDYSGPWAPYRFLSDVS